STARWRASTRRATTCWSWAGSRTSTWPTRAARWCSTEGDMAASSPEVMPSDAIAGVVVVRPLARGDDRGRSAETYRRSWFPGREMVQGNRSDKVAGSLVGLHYHLHQADYWYVVRGTARVVLHDLREGSPTEGATLTFDMGDGNECGVYIPP